ncbi:arsenate-mycothiol transferase ArsC [Robertkochia flava]|uniref:arsenate-mycothiol transferase ArsC n=1 Tax=Robertkochia flava TaxID=3447986 RepID=UPI001CCBB702|nr:low molecular weight phosphatase family protein [Robertkochia marina]
MKKNYDVLFICTGNYYRSRFAEILFNHQCQIQNLEFTSISRGLKLWSGNEGPLSRHTKAYMEQQEIDITEYLHMPRSLSLQDLRSAPRIIAMDETEHKVLMQDQFPDWAEKITYWQFEDDYIKDPDQVLPGLDRKVTELVDALKKEYFHMNLD